MTRLYEEVAAAYRIPGKPVSDEPAVPARDYYAEFGQHKKLVADALAQAANAWEVDEARSVSAQENRPGYPLPARIIAQRPADKLTILFRFGDKQRTVGWLPSSYENSERNAVAVPAAATAAQIAALVDDVLMPDANAGWLAIQDERQAQQRAYEEAQEKRMQPLRSRVRGLMEALADSWRIDSEEPNRWSNYETIYITRQRDGLKLEIWTIDGGDRLGVAGVSPKDDHRFHRSHFDHENLKRVTATNKITVTAKKTDEQVARDITRRLMPQVEAWHVEDSREIAEAELAEATRKSNCAALAELLPRGYGDKFEKNLPGDGWLRAGVTHSVFAIQLHTNDEELARRTLVATLSAGDSIQTCEYSERRWRGIKSDPTFNLNVSSENLNVTKALIADILNRVQEPATERAENVVAFPDGVN